MGRKNLIYNFKPLVSGDMSSTSLTGAVTDVSQFDTITYDFQWTGGQTTNGSIGIQYSRDLYEPRVWRDINFGSTVTTDGASGGNQFIINEIGFQFTRPIYTRTNGSASGALNIAITATNKGA